MPLYMRYKDYDTVSFSNPYENLGNLKMHLMVFNPAIRSDSFSTNSNCNLRRPFFPLKSLLNLAEIVDGPSILASRAQSHVTNLNIGRFDGDKSRRHSQRISASGRFRKRDDEKTPKSSDSNSANQEEIISLFRRIQSSISKEESVSSRKQSSKSSNEKPPAESVLDVLHQSRNQIKVNTLNERGEKVLSIRRGELKNKDRTNYSSVPDLKLTRPPSNFVKRSPIPTAPNSIPGIEEKNIASAVTGNGKALHLEKIEEMKLPALKELAKSKGLKGYSKLKKSELMELLRP